jgi:long-chain fatty acid transport protein
MMLGISAKLLSRFALLGLIVSGKYAWAGAFAFSEQTARAVGQASALTAGIEDPSAVFFNPAALNEIEGNQILGGGMYIYTASSVKNSGVTSKNIHDDSFVPTMFANYHIPKTDFSIAAGVYSPFGLATSYGENSFTRFAAIRSELRTMYVTPSLAWQATPWLSLGGGVSFVHSSALLSRQIFLGGPEAKLRFTATDNAYGYNFGVLVKANNQLKLGLTYRSRVNLNFDNADVKFGAPPVTFTKSSGTNVPLPPIISAGINWQATPRWSLEFVYDYAHWSEFKQLKANFQTPLLGGLIPGLFIPQDWKNSSTVRLGTAYKINDGLTLRGGATLDETPIPNRTLGPAIPGADLLSLNAGIGYSWKDLTIDLGYMAVFYKNRRVNNNVLETGGISTAIPFPGLPGSDRYETFQNFVAIHLGYRF